MNADEATRAADMKATRAARWDQSGPTSQVKREVKQIRSQGAALDALTRQTDEQIRGAQGTPQAVAGAAGNSTWDPNARRWNNEMRPPDAGNAPTIEERLSKLAGAYKSVSGRDLDPTSLMTVMFEPDLEKRKQLLDTLTQGNPELSQQIAEVMQSLMGGRSAAAPGAGTATGRPAAAGGADPLDEFRRKQ